MRKAGRPKTITRRDLALRRPIPKTWLPQPGQRVYLPYSSKRVLHSPTGWIIKALGQRLLVAYWPVYHHRYDAKLRYILVPTCHTRPAPQLTSFEDQLTILRDMVKLTHGPDGVRDIRLGEAAPVCDNGMD